MIKRHVTLYSTSDSPYGQAEKTWLERYQITYTECLVDEIGEEQQVMIAKSGQMSVPVTVIAEAGTEQVVIGFDESRLREVLDLKT